MQLPEEIQAKVEADRKEAEARMHAETQAVDAELLKGKSWIQANLASVVSIGACCFLIGCFVGYFVLKFFEHR